MRKPITTCMVCVLILMTTTAHAAESVKDLLVSALKSPDGKASGSDVVGREVDSIHSIAGATDPVKGEVSVIKRLDNEPGCARLSLKLIQPNTPTKDGKKGDFFMRYELNFCKNGTPPSIGVDVGVPKTGQDGK